eukprot:gene2758-1743_t
MLTMHYQYRKIWQPNHQYDHQILVCDNNQTQTHNVNKNTTNQVFTLNLNNIQSEQATTQHTSFQIPHPTCPGPANQYHATRGGYPQLQKYTSSITPAKTLTGIKSTQVANPQVSAVPSAMQDPSTMQEHHGRTTPLTKWPKIRKLQLNTQKSPGNPENPENPGIQPQNNTPLHDHKPTVRLYDAKFNPHKQIHNHANPRPQNAQKIRKLQPKAQNAPWKPEIPRKSRLHPQTQEETTKIANWCNVSAQPRKTAQCQNHPSKKDHPYIGIPQLHSPRNHNHSSMQVVAPTIPTIENANRLQKLHPHRKIHIVQYRTALTKADNKGNNPSNE